MHVAVRYTLYHGRAEVRKLYCLVHLYIIIIIEALKLVTIEVCN